MVKVMVLLGGGNQQWGWKNDPEFLIQASQHDLTLYVQVWF